MACSLESLNLKKFKENLYQAYNLKLAEASWLLSLMVTEPNGY